MKRSLRILLSILSGVLLSLAWLGFPGLILFVAFIPLLFLDYFFVQHKTEYRSVSIWGYAFLSFFIWNIATTWWIMHATLAGAVMAIVTNSFLMSLTFWLAHIARRNFKSSLGYIALVVFWISFEYFHFHWDIEWPWLTLGNGFANNIKIIQWYEFTGYLGGSLWVLVINIVLFQILRNLLEKKPVTKSVYPVSVFIILLVLPVSFSVKRYNSYVEKENPKNIVVVQPNIDPYSEKYDAEAENEKLRKFLNLAGSKADSKTDFIIGPETLFENPGFWKENDLENNSQLNQLSGFLERYPNAEMVFGVSSYKIYPDKNSAPSTARTNKQMTYDMFNTAIFLGNTGQTQIYHKSMLVVGVEKMPFAKYLGFLGDFVINIGGTTNSLGSQDEPSNFISKDKIRVAPVICYESVFGEFVTKYVQKGAELIFIITNDGWWKNTPGYHQHLSFARLRAIETRRSIARCANTGISCFINQRGDISQSTEWWVPAAINGTINANDKMTFYVRFGDYIARISLFIGVLLILRLIVIWLSRKNSL
ncbi:MAG TPA: apolipoprotein N-acyltransferase [Draconibacterium sp.]|nr:apolipoprotein N-acyltransferase [Draconibacterium sp.]